MEKINLILDKLEEKFKKTFKFNIREGMGDDGCDPGYSKSGKECKKNTKTVEVFLTYPLFLLIILLVYVANYSSFIGFVKTFPLETIEDSLKCKVPDIDKLFNKKSKFDIVNIKHDKLTESDKYLYDRVWVGITKPSSNEFTVLINQLFYQLSSLNTTIAGFLKLNVFKNEWNTSKDVKKINKGTYIGTMIGLFLYFFYFVGMIFIYILAMGPAIILEFLRALATLIYTVGLGVSDKREIPESAKKDMERMGVFIPIVKAAIDNNKSWMDTKSTFQKIGYFIIWGAISFGTLIFGALAACIASVVASGAIALTGFYDLFLKGFFNFYPDKNDKGYWGTALLNMIWDYKYILALVAILLWIGEFHFYTKGDDNIFKFINNENRDMTTGLLAGICSILLIKQQLNYTSLIPKTETKRDEVRCSRK